MGGVAVALAIILAPVLARAIFHASIPPLPPGVWIGAALSLGLGLLDDRRPMPPLGKLVGQLAAALCLVLWGPNVPWLRASPVSLGIAILGVTALLNAINFLDAMDGVVGTVIPITAAGFVTIALLYGAPVNLVLAWGLIGASAGFLVYNAPGAHLPGRRRKSLPRLRARYARAPGAPERADDASPGIGGPPARLPALRRRVCRRGSLDPAPSAPRRRDRPHDPSTGTTPGTMGNAGGHRGGSHREYVPRNLDLGVSGPAIGDCGCPHFWACVCHFWGFAETH